MYEASLFLDQKCAQDLVGSAARVASREPGTLTTKGPPVVDQCKITTFMGPHSFRIRLGPVQIHHDDSSCRRGWSTGIDQVVVTGAIEHAQGLVRLGMSIQDIVEVERTWVGRRCKLGATRTFRDVCNSATYSHRCLLFCSSEDTCAARRLCQCPCKSVSVAVCVSCQTGLCVPLYLLSAPLPCPPFCVQ